MEVNKKRLFVGNLPFSATEDDIRDHFASAGTLTEVKLVLDKFNGNRSKGIAFVEFETEEEAEAAIAKFDGQDFDGRPLHVAVSRPQAPRNGGDRGDRRY